MVHVNAVFVFSIRLIRSVTGEYGDGSGCAPVRLRKTCVRGRERGGPLCEGM